MLAVNVPKNDELYVYSNPIKAQAKAFKYLGKKAVLYKSQNVNKKYAIIDPSGKNADFIILCEYGIFIILTHINILN